MRVLVVGLDGAGKSTVVQSWLGQVEGEVAPTVGFAIETFAVGPYTVHVWDVGGQESLRPYWRNHFEATDGMVWVVDAADRGRMEEVRAALAAVLADERLLAASVLVLANKQDIPGALSAEEVAQALGLEGDKVPGESRHWRVAGVSAKSPSAAAALRAELAWLVQDVASRVFVFD